MQRHVQIVCALALAQGFLAPVVSAAGETRPAPPIAERLHSATAAVKGKAAELGTAAKVRARQIGASASQLSRTVAERTKAGAHSVGNAGKSAVAKAKAALHQQPTPRKAEPAAEAAAR
jgi:hypothetical protein